MHSEWWRSPQVKKKKKRRKTAVHTQLTARKPRAASTRVFIPVHWRGAP
jgi:hypothetical protein